MAGIDVDGVRGPRCRVVIVENPKGSFGFPTQISATLSPTPNHIWLEKSRDAFFGELPRSVKA